MTRTTGRWWSLALLLVGGACQQPSTFICSDDTSCPDGWCEPVGYCSFPADECPSGRRYGQFSGAYAGQCVMDGDGQPTSSAGSAAGSGATSGASDGEDATGPSATSSDPSAGSDGPDATGGSQSCAGAEFCFPIPAGWDGPVRLLEDGSTCADLVHEGALSYAGAWGCDCACEPTGPTSCDDVAVELQVFEGTNCPGDPIGTEQLSEVCEDFDYVDTHSLRAVAEGVGTCDVDTLVDADDVTAVEPRAVCGVSAGAACPGGVCTGEAGLCIHAEGERECPSGFDERSVVYASFADGRGCTPCGCEAQYSCGGSYAIKSAEIGCENQGSVFLPVGSCSGAMLYVRGGFRGEIDEEPVLDCQASDAAQTGEIQPLAPRTVCCEGG